MVFLKYAGSVLPLRKILSGKVPFHQYTTTAVILAVVRRHERPPKEPQESSSGRSYAEVWKIAEQCWVTDTGARPTMVEAVGQWPPSERKPDEDW